MRRSKATSNAASLLGKRSWTARKHKYTPEVLREMLSKAGKKATGRPRLPDSKVKPATLYQRERRARLRAEAKLKKGGKVQ
jgi:hypothetical protein